METIMEDGQRDRWFSAQEALEYGIVDQIVEQLDDVRPNLSKRRMGM
jgi:ATP-dependent Clp protease protease subunit